MPSTKRELSEYRSMWLIAMFDVPVLTKTDRRRYARLRKALLRMGFSKLQLSVYARFCGSQDAGRSLRQRIRDLVPPEGHVRLLMLTDRQFGKMDVFIGPKRVSPEDPPQQIALF